MTSLGADYSDARPGGQKLKDAGVTAVGRYLAADSRGITAAEYKDLADHGIGVWLCREGAATGMLNGYSQGVSDAKVAQAQIVAAGLPTDSVVFAAADFDVVTLAQFNACDNYLAGFASVLGKNRVGIYGGTYYLNHVYDVGMAVAFWVSASTSFAHGQAAKFPIHFQQTTNTPPVPGSDHDYIFDTTTLAGNGGAIPLEALMALKDTLEIFTAPNRGYFIGGAGFAYDVGDKDGVNGQDKLNILGKIGVPTTTLLTAEFDQLRIVLRGSDLVSETAAAVTVPKVDPAPIVAAVVAALPVGTAPDTTALVTAVQSALAAQIAALPSAVVAAEGKALSNG